MAHSHMSFQHFMKQLQKKRDAKVQRIVQPAWISEFVDEVAELFIPLETDGRVGYECQMNERGWKILMFLGSTEIIGGCDDGSSHHSNFEINIADLTGIFSKINVLRWESYPDASDPNSYQNHSRVIVEGVNHDHFIQLELHSVPPRDIGPGFKKFPNGKRAIV